jgi:hypothetical protein
MLFPQDFHLKNELPERMANFAFMKVILPLLLMMHKTDKPKHLSRGVCNRLSTPIIMLQSVKRPCMRRGSKFVGIEHTTTSPSKRQNHCIEQHLQWISSNCRRFLFGSFIFTGRR